MSRLELTVINGGNYNSLVGDYLQFKKQAKKWARYALENKRDGFPWEECARRAHENLKWALMIIY